MSSIIPKDKRQMPPVQSVLPDRETFIGAVWALAPGADVSSQAIRTLFARLYDAVDAHEKRIIDCEASAVLTAQTVGQVVTPSVPPPPPSSGQQGGPTSLAEVAQAYANSGGGQPVTEGGDGGMGSIMSQAMQHAQPHNPNAVAVAPAAPIAVPTGPGSQGEQPVDPALLALINQAEEAKKSAPPMPPNGGK